jgi:hypothetical protein
MRRCQRATKNECQGSWQVTTKLTIGIFATAWAAW